VPRQILKPSLIVCLLASPAIAWAMFKPIRVLAPEWAGDISCVSSRICIDNALRYREASELYEGALRFVASAVGPFQHNPRVVFCSTEDCFRSFGFIKASASTVGNFGIVISPRGWTPYYVRHEMVHHLQAEQLGALTLWLGPEWFIEGMAYSLSKDPRRPLSEPWQQHRAEFEGWYQKVGKERLWEEARKL
jgi:hypothetical protein